MRIKVINPNTTRSMTESIGQAAAAAARSDTKIIAVNPERGPVSIENFHDEYIAAVGVLEEVHKGLKEDVDAFIIACYGDPGLYAAREISSVPVIGIAEASMHLASLVSPNFSILAVIPRVKLLLEEVVKRYSMFERCVSIRSTDMSVLDFEEDPERGMRELKEAGYKAVTEDGAQALCLGCAGMVSFCDSLEKELEVPVFDGVTAAVKLAEALVDLGKSTSKKLYFKDPEKKLYIGYPEILQT